ncbi:E3 ubiquitin-protein ligase SIAH1 [Tribolium castaneum]|uniref:E3 ubiquitin-protein ligase SIAH1 n=1 Tax=Tribolium castaneum TaxID=7070 RepID=UPI0030FDF9CF
MASQLDRVIMCPICLDTMTKPIIQCQTGHSMCGDCVKDNLVKNCPQCRGPISTTRNYQLEQIIENMPRDLKCPCFFADKGCKYMLSPTEKADHEVECKNRKFLCEGRKFAKWKCEWFGNYGELEQHFKDVHRNCMEYKMQTEMNIRLDKDFKDVQIISFFNGAQYFWYKFVVDVALQRVFWVFQFIGPKKQAKNYYYEFEISNGPIRKFKVTEVCDNDVVKAEDLFRDEKCVSLSFNSVKSYLNDNGKLPIKFRIMAMRKHNEASK